MDTTEIPSSPDKTHSSGSDAEEQMQRFPEAVLHGIDIEVGEDPDVDSPTFFDILIKPNREIQLRPIDSEGHLGAIVKLYRDPYPKHVSHLSDQEVVFDKKLFDHVTVHQVEADKTLVAFLWVKDGVTTIASPPDMYLRLFRASWLY